MKVGDLVRVDYSGWKIAKEAGYLRTFLVHGLLVDKYKRSYDDKCYIMIWTTDGEYKTFPCEEQIPPTITVVSAGNH